MVSIRCIYMVFVILLFNRDTVCGDKELCATSYGHNVNCDKQIFHNDSSPSIGGLCSVSFYPTNSSQCFNKVFPEMSLNNADLGKLQLKPYFMDYNMLHFTLFNVTMSNIKWKSLSFRFQATTDYDEMKPSFKNHCRDITIDSDGPLFGNSSLSYDCLWTAKQDKLYQDYNYIFQYQAFNEHSSMFGKYVFIVPNSEVLAPTVDISAWTPFVYIEIKMDKLVLHVAEAPDKFAIASYRILVYRNSLDLNDIVESIQLLANVTRTHEEGELLYEFETCNSQGFYFFDVTPIGDKCPGGVCKGVQSAIVEMVSDHRGWMICIASTATVIAALIVFNIFLIKRFQLYHSFKKTNDTLLEESPHVLIVYSPTNKIHNEAVIALADCLRENGVIVSHDGDIERTAHGDPYIWCQGEFQKAHCLLYVVSPAGDTDFSNDLSDTVFTGVHKNLDVLSLKFLRDSMASQKSGKRLLNVTFEYCTGGKVPTEMSTAKSFQLPNDWDSMVQYIYKGTSQKDGLKKTDNEKILLANFLLCINRAKYLKMNGSCGNRMHFDDTKILI